MHHVASRVRRDTSMHHMHRCVAARRCVASLVWSRQVRADKGKRPKSHSGKRKAGAARPKAHSGKTGFGPRLAFTPAVKAQLMARCGWSPGLGWIPDGRWSVTTSSGGRKVLFTRLDAWHE